MPCPPEEPPGRAVTRRRTSVTCGVGPVRHLAGVAPGQSGDGLVWRLVFSFSQVEILENTICVKNVSNTIV